MDLSLMCKVYDETVEIAVVRNGSSLQVQFCDLKEGDYIPEINKYVEEAHQCEDPHYNGWIMFDTDGTDHYPEDFGAQFVGYSR